MIEVERALETRRPRSRPAWLDLGLGVEDGRDLAHRSARRLHLAVQLRELLQRLEDEREQADERDQRADRRACRRRAGARRAQSAMTVAITPRSSIAGKNTEIASGRTSWRGGSRRSARRTVRWNARSRLYACTTAMPASDSAIWAVTAAMRLRTSVKATCERTWNQRVSDERRRQDHRARRARGASRATNRPMIAATQREAVGDERREPLGEHVGERVDVAREAGDDPARSLLGEVAERERGEVVEEVLAQPRARCAGRAARARRSCSAPRIQAVAFDGRRRSPTSSRSRVSSCALMPLSIASRDERASRRPDARRRQRGRDREHEAWRPRPLASRGVAARGRVDAGLTLPTR